jgi:hypothetical protein
MNPMNPMTVMERMLETDHRWPILVLGRLINVEKSQFIQYYAVGLKRRLPC